MKNSEENRKFIISNTYFEKNRIHDANRIRKKTIMSISEQIKEQMVLQVRKLER